MSPSGDDRVTTSDPADAERAEHPDSFDPGPETGYLRRGHRDHDLDIDSGSAPFDPGPDHYDDRRAERAARKAEKAERKRREREEKERAARERADRKARETREAARRERAGRARQVADEAARAERQHDEREELLREQRRRAREAEAEKADRAHTERERLREAERERAEQEREAGRHAKQAARERRDAELREERERIAAQRAKRDQAERERAQRRKPDPKSVSSGATAVADPPRAKPPSPGPAAAAPPRRPRVQDLDLTHAGGPSPQPDAPRLSHKPGHVSLRLPTAKVGVALLLVAAVAALAGSAAGLPIPVLDRDSASESSAESGVDPAALALLDSGTPVGLTKGPFHPVVGNGGYGESAAKFGASRGGRSHEGQDVFTKPGTPLVAVRDGVVVDGASENGQYSGGRGNYVVIYSQLDDRSYVYLHMLKPALVSKGDSVAAGQPLGQVGCTGSCLGPHLHFEVRNGRASLRAETKAVDPLPLLKQWPKVPVPGRS